MVAGPGQKGTVNMRRKAVDRLPETPGELILGPEYHRHLVRVLRLNIGDSILLFDRKGFESKAKIVAIETNSVAVDCLAPVLVDKEPECDITLAFALPKVGKPDFIFQKGTELGAKRFLVFLSERTVTRPAPEKMAERLSRWSAIVQGAAEQSGRTTIPDVSFYPTLEAVMENIGAGLRLALLPEADQGLSAHLRPLPDAVNLLIGPEGGFSETEIQLIIGQNFLPVTFGKRILRAETAAIVAVAHFSLDPVG